MGFVRFGDKDKSRQETFILTTTDTPIFPDGAKCETEITKAFVISVSHLARSGKMGMSVFVKIKVSCPPFSLAPNPADQQRTPVD